MGRFTKGNLTIKKKLFYSFSLILLTLGCWSTARIYLGFTIVVGPILFVIAGWLFVFLLTLAIRRGSHSVWIYAGIFILIAWSLPASIFVRLFPIQEGEPFGFPLSFTLLAMISLALIVSALLFHSSLNLHNTWRKAESLENGDDKRQRQKTGWFIVASVFLGLLLLISALYHFYWFMVWDTTYDGLGYLWLPLPTLAVLSVVVALFKASMRKYRLVVFVYLLLVPVIFAVTASAFRVDFRQLTQERAARVGQAIEGYYAREGYYPRNLGQVLPRDALSIPGPVIIYGQEWCYDAGDDYYRLGYIDREHWSAPHFIGRIYQIKGQLPDLHGTCEREAAALQKRHPDFLYEYWEADE